MPALVKQQQTHAAATDATVQAFDSLPDSALITDRQTAAVAGISPSTLWRLNARGTLRCVRVGVRCTRWRVGDVRAFLNGEAQS